MKHRERTHPSHKIQRSDVKGVLDEMGRDEGFGGGEERADEGEASTERVELSSVGCEDYSDNNEEKGRSGSGSGFDVEEEHGEGEGCDRGKGANGEMELGRENDKRSVSRRFRHSNTAVLLTGTVTSRRLSSEANCSHEKRRATTCDSRRMLAMHRANSRAQLTFKIISLRGVSEAERYKPSFAATNVPRVAVASCTVIRIQGKGKKPRSNVLFDIVNEDEKNRNARSEASR